MARKKVCITVYLEPEQEERLRQVALRRRIAQSELVRMGVAHILAEVESGRLEIGAPL